jgi:hypothetical protein
MSEKEHEKYCCQSDDFCDLVPWTDETKKAYKIAMLKKKEKILEAKLAFIREINLLISK